MFLPWLPHWRLAVANDGCLLWSPARPESRGYIVGEGHRPRDDDPNSITAYPLAPPIRSTWHQPSTVDFPCASRDQCLCVNLQVNGNEANAPDAETILQSRGWNSLRPGDHGKLRRWAMANAHLPQPRPSAQIHYTALDIERVLSQSMRQLTIERRVDTIPSPPLSAPSAPPSLHPGHEGISQSTARRPSYGTP